MVVKTPTQMLLEARNPGKSIKEIIEDALRNNQGERMIPKTANALDVTPTTLYHWCRDLDINIDRFRYAHAVSGQGK